jgi:hypothetical protein
MTGWESNGVAFPAPTASLYSRTDQGPASWSVEMAVRRCTSIATLRSYGGIRTLLLESIRSCFLRKALKAWPELPGHRLFWHFAISLSVT